MSTIFFTGPLSRSKFDKNATVHGEFQILLPSAAGYMVFVYDPILDETILDVENVATAPLTKISFDVHRRHRTWVAGAYTEVSAFINLFESIKCKHAPELCFKYGDLSNEFDGGYGLGSALTTKVTAFRAKMAAKQTAAAAAPATTPAAAATPVAKA